VKSKELDRLLTQALNGWGAHARAQLEHDDIRRIREAQRALHGWRGRPKGQPRRPLGPLVERRRARREWLLAHRELGWEALLVGRTRQSVPIDEFRILFRRMQLAGLYSQTSGVFDGLAWVLTSAHEAAQELSKTSKGGA
jgi:hypothetical protein